MKRNVLLTLLTAVLGLLIGYFVGARPNPSRFDDIAVNFRTCTKECDAIEDSVRKKHHECSDELTKTLDDIMHDCPDPQHWTQVCIDRLIQYSVDRRKCLDEYEDGLDRIKECRTKCNNLISVHEN